MGDLVLNNLVYPALLAGFIGISALVLLIIWGSWIFEKIGSLFKKKIPTRQYFRVVNPEGVEVDNYSSADDEYLEQWYETKEEAIEIANDTDYGLTNYIQTQDNDKVQRVARKLRSGMVDVNGAGIAVDAPFGGFKHSGIGREAGKEGLLEFLEVKSVGGWN